MFLSVDDSDFWGRNLGPQQALIDQGGHAGFDTSFFLLGKAEANAPVVAPLRMEPGYVLPRHAHDCYRMEIVVSGSVIVGDRVLGPGSVMISGPGELYGPHIAGPEGAITFEIFSEYNGGHRMVMELPAGDIVKYDMRDVEGAQKILENVRNQGASRT